MLAEIAKFALEAYKQNDGYFGLFLLAWCIFFAYKWLSSRKRCCELLTPVLDKIGEDETKHAECVLIAISNISRLLTEELSKQIKNIITTELTCVTDLNDRMDGFPDQVKLLLDSDIQQLKTSGLAINALESTFRTILDKDLQHLREINAEFRDFINDHSSRIANEITRVTNDISAISRDISTIKDRDKVSSDQLMNLFTRVDDLRGSLTTLQTLLGIALGNRSGAGF